MWFHTNLITFCFISSKNDIGVLMVIFDGDVDAALNLYIALDNMVILTTLIFPICDHETSFHFIVSCSISLNNTCSFQYTVFHIPC